MIYTEEPTANDPLQGTLNLVLNKLCGGRTALAVDRRVGHFTLTKLYTLCSLYRKLAMASDLIQEQNRLSGNAMGGSVMEFFSVRQLMESEYAWRGTYVQIGSN